MTAPRLAQLVLLFCLPLTGWAQPGPGEKSATLADQLKIFDQKVEHFRERDARLSQVTETDQDLMLYRRAEIVLQLLQELNRLTREVAGLPEADPRRAELVARFGDDLSGVIRVIVKGTEELSRHIARINAEVKGDKGAARIAREAYRYSLERLRIQYYQSMGDVIEAQRAIGLPVADVLNQLGDQLYLFAEALAGRLVYTGAALAGLQAKLRDNPENAELADAEKSYAGEHARDLDRLAAISKLLGRLGLDNTEYQSLLLKHGQSVSVFDLDAAVVEQRVREVWGNLRKGIIEEAPDYIVRLFGFLLVLLIFYYLSRLARRVVIAASERSRGEASTLLKDRLASMSSGVVLGIGLLMALSQVGISLGPMLAGLGVVGFIVGFALQDTLGNFAAGGMILIYRPYDVDDVVEVAGAFGKVKKMSLVSTTITTFDNQTLVVPNSKIWGDVIKNVTAQKVRRVDMEFGISYGDDIEKAETVLRNIIDDHELVLPSPEPTIKLHALGDSSVNFIVRPWVKTSDYWDVYWDVTREVKKRFDREGISIPFPQRDVHLYRDTR